MTKAASAPRPRSDSIIGARMRIDGHIDFAGSVRIHGSVHGDVTASGDTTAKAVVAESGSVVGTIRAANIVIQGLAVGPLVSDRTIEIFPSGRCTGGAQYNALSVQEGGVIDGMLQLSSGIDVARPRKSARSAAEKPRPEIHGPATVQPDDASIVASAPPAGLPALRHAGAAAPARRRRIVVWAAASLVVALALAWTMRGPGKSSTEPARPLASAPAVPAERSPPSPAPMHAPSPPAPALLPNPAAPASKTAPPAAVPAPAMPRPQAASPRAEDSGGRVVAIEGTNADKPAGVFFVVTREAAVIHRKKREAAGEGMRIEIARGRNLSLQVARDEIARVTSGRDLDVYYQGRKVPPSTVEAGSWISFVPASRPTPATSPPAAPAAVAPTAPAAADTANRVQ